MGACFPDFSYSLKSCVALFAFEGITSSKRLAPREKDPHYSGHLGILGVEESFSIDAHAPYLPLALVGEVLSFYAFSQSNKARPVAKSLLFSSPRAVH